MRHGVAPSASRYRSALVASARSRVTVPVLGPTPVLGLIAVILVLALGAAVLWLVRSSCGTGRGRGR